MLGEAAGQGILQRSVGRHLLGTCHTQGFCMPQSPQSNAGGASRTDTGQTASLPAPWQRALQWGRSHRSTRGRQEGRRHWRLGRVADWVTKAACQKLRTAVFTRVLNFCLFTLSTHRVVSTSAFSTSMWICRSSRSWKDLILQLK